MGLEVREPDFVREQQRRRPVCASVQSDQRLCCSLSGKYDRYTWHRQKIKKILSSFCSSVGRCEPLKTGFHASRPILQLSQRETDLSFILLHTKNCHSMTFNQVHTHTMQSLYYILCYKVILCAFVLLLYVVVMAGQPVHLTTLFPGQA